MAAPRELDLTVTLDAAWQAWAAHLYARVEADTMSPDTVRGYLTYARKGVDHLGPDRTCDSVEAPEIDAWVATYRARQCGPATLRFCHKGIGGLLAYADSRRWIRENPMRDIAKVPLRHTMPGPERAALTKPEMDAMIAGARAGHGHRHATDTTRTRDEIVIRLAGESGLRNADIRNLDLTDIVQDQAGNWHAQIRRGKGRKARTTPLTDECARLILTWVQDHRPEPGLLPDRYDKHHKLLKGDRDALLLSSQRHRLSAPTVAGIVDRISRAAIGRHFVPHGLRHTTGTLLLREAKADLATVAHILGHSDVSVTSRYLDTRGDEAAAAVNRRRPTTKPRGPKDLPPGPAEPRWAECGTRTGWNRHRKEKIPKCGPCRMWKRREREAREQLLALMPKRAHGTVEGYRDWRCRCDACQEAVRPKVSLIKKQPRTRRVPHRVSLVKRQRPVARCGTPSGYARHRDRNEPACRACLDAVASAQRDRRTRLREQRTGSPEIRRPVAECGTTGGYKQHRKRREPPCKACLAAVAAWSRERAALGEDRRAGGPVRLRGICPGCGELRALALATGGMRKHDDCPGNGQPPADATSATSLEGAGLRLVTDAAAPGEQLLRRLRLATDSDEQAC
jgi:site-specific recombinase XerD